MKKTSVILIIALLAVSLSGYSQGKKAYSIKSGTVNYEMEMLGMTVTSILYFDNYGAKECTTVKMDMFGQKIESRTFRKDEYVYSLDMVAKTYQKEVFKEKAGDYSSMNFEELSEAEAGITKNGTETFMGKKCIIYDMDKDGAIGKFWIWNDLMLKMEVESQGFTIVMEANKITEGSISQDLFEIPSDFTEKTN